MLLHDISKSVVVIHDKTRRAGLTMLVCQLEASKMKWLMRGKTKKRPAICLTRQCLQFCILQVGTGDGSLGAPVLQPPLPQSVGVLQGRVVGEWAEAGERSSSSTSPCLLPSSCSALLAIAGKSALRATTINIHTYNVNMEYFLSWRATIFLSLIWNRQHNSQCLPACNRALDHP